MIEAIVIGGDHHNTLGVIRALGRNGVPVEVYLLHTEDTRPYVTTSRYVNSSFFFDSADSLGDALVERGGKDGSKRVVLCCHDALAEMLDRRQEELSPYYFFPHSVFSSLTRLQNKSEMAALALKCGMPVPEYSKEFPLMLKPVNSVYGSKRDIFVCYSREEYEKYFEDHSLENTIVQKFIDKTMEYQLIGCVAADGCIIIPGHSEILRPCKGSNTSFLRYSGFDGFDCNLKACFKFLEASGFRGLFSMEFLRDKSGKDYFMEINFRNDGNAICAVEAGVNLPYIWYKSCLGADYRGLAGKEVATVYTIPEMDELSLAKSGQISLKEALADFRKADCGMEWDKNDRRPFCALLWRNVKSKLHLK